MQSIGVVISFSSVSTLLGQPWVTTFVTVHSVPSMVALLVPLNLVALVSATLTVAGSQGGEFLVMPVLMLYPGGILFASRRRRRRWRQGKSFTVR